LSIQNWVPLFRNQVGMTLLACSEVVSRRTDVGEIQLCVGDPDASDEAVRERRRGGLLVVEGLTAWALEPPGKNADGLADGLWLTADGVLARLRPRQGHRLRRHWGTGHVGWFLFFNNLNAFGYLAGGRAEFRWS